MFLMNYLFDFSQTNAIFSGDRPGGVLFKSTNWLKLNPNKHLPMLPPVPEPGDPFPAGFNPELAFWEDQGDMDSGTIVIGSTPAPAADEGNVGIRIIPDPTSPVVLPLGPGGVTLTLVVCFGKPSPAKQNRASPFELAPGIARTTYNLPAQPSNTVDAGGNPVGWFLPLGLIKFRPTIPPSTKFRTFRFEFSVGIEVVNGADTRQFSHDPDMDIGV